MDVVFPIACRLTEEEQRLVDKVKHAVAGIDCNVSPHARWKRLRIEAVIWHAPLRLDFQATDGNPIVAYLLSSPLQLTDDLFDGGSLSEKALVPFENACAAFVRYLLEETGA